MTIPWIPLFPDAGSPVTETLIYPTSILTSTSGREQRIRVREFPDREFSMRMVEMDARHVSRLLHALEQGHDFNAYVPFWPEAFQLTTAHVATDTDLNTTRSTERIEWFGQFHHLMLWNGEGNYARYPITGAAGNIVQVDPLAENWPANTWCVPLFACKIIRIGQIDRATDNVAVIDQITVRVDWALGRRNPIKDRLYWRTIAPGNAFIGSLGETYFGDFWGVAATQTTPWVTPTLTNVESNQGTLNPTKGVFSGLVTSVSTSLDVHQDYSGLQLRFVGPALKAQTIPPFMYRVAYRATAPSGGVAGYAHMQIGFFRPSTNTVLARYEDRIDTVSRWFRYVYKERISRIWVPVSLDVQDGDRMFLDVVTNVDVASGISTTNGDGVNIGYNGDNEDFVDDRFQSVHQSASWVELPKLLYFTRDPAVAYP